MIRIDVSNLLGEKELRCSTYNYYRNTVNPQLVQLDPRILINDAFIIREYITYISTSSCLYYNILLMRLAHELISHVPYPT